MKKIYKYQLEVTDYQDIKVPVGAEFISVVSQRNDLVAYFLVDPTESDMLTKTFHIIGTGHPIYDNDLIEYKFVGTYLTHGDNLVWHVFLKTS